MRPRESTGNTAAEEGDFTHCTEMQTVNMFHEPKKWEASGQLPRHVLLDVRIRNCDWNRQSHKNGPATSALLALPATEVHRGVTLVTILEKAFNWEVKTHTGEEHFHRTMTG